MSTDPRTPPHTPPVAPAGPSVLSRVGRWIRTSPLLHLVVIVALSFALTGVALSLMVYNRRAREATAEERRTRLEERTRLLHEAQDAMAGQAAALLRLSALPLGWAMRTALLTHDTTSVGTYIGSIIREPNVTSVALVDASGKVANASNDKLQGKVAREAFPGVAFDGQSPSTVVTGTGVRVVVPLMAYDRRLGTLILGYTMPSWSGAAPPHQDTRR